MNKTLFAAAALMLAPLAIPVAPSADASPAGPRRSDEPETGLAVTMERITPAYLQPGEPITVSGQITNLDREAWGDVQVYLLAPGFPATSTEELADVAASPPTAVDGERITNLGSYAELGRIAPGATEPYSLTIPFQRLGIPPSQPGVYTLTVQARGNDPFGARATAGSARSFIPLMPDDTPSVGVATIWPFREDVARRPDGEYVNREELVEAVSEGGRLRTMLNLAATSGSTPVSLLADPALLDALLRIANGTTERPGAPASPAESPSPTDESALDDIGPTSEEQRVTQDFLDDFTALASEHSLWVEGYGGPDLVTLAGGYDGSRLFRTITRATAATMNALDLPDPSRVYLPTGELDVEALDALGPKLVTFVTSDQVRRWQPSDGPIGTVRAEGGRARVVVTHDELLEGSPAPGPTDTALQIRQRLLAETALLALGAENDPQASAPSVAVLANDDWDPGDDAAAADFFAAFDAPWIRSTNLDAELTAGPRQGAKHLRIAELPDKRVDPPLPDSLARSADQIRGRGVIMWAITRQDRRILNYYDQSASLTVSEQWRPDPEVSQEMADKTITGVDRQIGSVRIEAPEFVTLSSSSGRFPLTITNDLSWPITVGVQLEAEDGGLRIQQDDLIAVDPEQSTTVNVQVNAEDVGVTEVTARLTTPKGRPFGEPATFKMRSSVVGTVIWIALGAAGAIVVLAVGRRIRRSTRSDPAGAEPDAS